MHPLTKLLCELDEELSGIKVDKIVTPWANERAEILKKTAYDGIITPKMIDLAFQLEPEVKNLEAKLDIASTARMIRVYSCWDIGEDDCVRIAQALAENVEKILIVKKDQCNPS